MNTIYRKARAIGAFLLIMSSTALANWTEGSLGFSTPAKSSNGSILGQLPSATLMISSDGRPTLNFYRSGTDGLYNSLCTGKEGQYRLSTFVWFNDESMTLPYSCSYGKYPSLGFYPVGQVEDKLVQLFKQASEDVRVTIDGVSFMYSAEGFSRSYSIIDQRARRKGEENFRLRMGSEEWLSGNLSVMGYNTYGQQEFDSPKALIFINRGGAVGVGFNYGPFGGGQTANAYCNTGVPLQGMFNAPSVTVNGTKVKMMGECKKYADAGFYYMITYPVTERGRSYIIQSFMSNNYVKIDKAFYPAKGFNKAYTSLKERVGGI